MSEPLPSTAKLLVIDTATPRAVVGVFNDRVLANKTSTGRARADDLVGLIDQALAASRLQLTDLDGIIVRRGLGSYTGLRVGLAVANTLAWALNIPLIGSLSQRKAPLDPETIAHRIRRLQSSVLRSPSSESWLLPIYRPWPKRATLK